jgi:hypothetical protein
MFHVVDRWLARLFAPMSAMLRDVPAWALPRLFSPF